MPIFIFVSIISIIVLWLMSLQMTLTEFFAYDVLKNEGRFSLYFFGICIIRAKLQFLSFDTATKRAKLLVNDKIVTVSLLPEAEDDSIFNYISTPLFSIVDFVFINIEFRFGNKKDAFITMLAVELVQVAACSFMSALKSTQEIDVKKNFVPVYDRDEISFEFDGIITVSIANIIYSLFFAFGKMLKKKSKQNYKQEQKENRVV